MCAFMFVLIFLCLCVCVCECVCTFSVSLSIYVCGCVYFCGSVCARVCVCVRRYTLQYISARRQRQWVGRLLIVSSLSGLAESGVMALREGRLSGPLMAPGTASQLRDITETCSLSTRKKIFTVCTAGWPRKQLCKQSPTAEAPQLALTLQFRISSGNCGGNWQPD